MPPLTRRFGPLLLAAALLFAAAPAARAEEPIAAPVIQSLQAEGYVVTDVSRTLLGRILITSHNDRYLREVVLNRRTGAIIDDQLFMQATGPDAGSTGAQPGHGGTSGDSGGNGAGGGGAGGAGGGGGGNGG
ncbi:MAG: hypothetical protein AB7S99_09210 [Pseudodonghicola sp.]